MTRFKTTQNHLIKTKVIRGYSQSQKIREHGKFYDIWLKKWIPLMLLSFSSGLFFVYPCLSSGGTHYQLTHRDKPFAIHFIDDTCGWIVGDNGLALKTVDGGKTWQRIKISDKTFNDVFFVGQKGWIVGGNRLILSTDDGGNIWKKKMESPNQSTDILTMLPNGTCPPQESSANSLTKVFFINKDKGFIVGADRTILKTEDGGSSWVEVSLDCMETMMEELIMNGIFSINFYGVFFLNEDSGWIVGDSGTILHSEDSGKEWTVQNGGLLPSLFSISFKNHNEGWAVGQNGFFLKTENGGKTWQNVSLEKKHSLYRIRIYDKYGVIVGDQATIIVTTDAGKTWDEVATALNPPHPWFVDAWILPAKSPMVLSVGKGIFLKTDILRHAK